MQLFLDLGHDHQASDHKKNEEEDDFFAECTNDNNGFASNNNYSNNNNNDHVNSNVENQKVKSFQIAFCIVIVFV